jgi:hypothetical protein
VDPVILRVGLRELKQALHFWSCCEKALMASAESWRIWEKNNGSQKKSNGGNSSFSTPLKSRKTLPSLLCMKRTSVESMEDQSLVES